MDLYIDEENETALTTMKKRNLIKNLMLPARPGGPKVPSLDAEFSKYTFFAELKDNHDSETFENIMGRLELKQIPAGQVLMNQDDEAAFSITLLKGRAKVFSSTEVPVPPADTTENAIYNYLQCVYDHQDIIHWKRVPYAQSVRSFLDSITRDRVNLVQYLQVQILQILTQRVKTIYNSKVSSLLSG